jgi:hypothetical protein
MKVRRFYAAYHAMDAIQCHKSLVHAAVLCIPHYPADEIKDRIAQYRQGTRSVLKYKESDNEISTKEFAQIFGGG